MLFARKHLPILLATILMVASSRPTPVPVLSDRDSFGIVQSSLSETTDIVVFGDSDHRSQEIKQMFFHFVENLYQADHSFECVFVEDSRKFQPSVDEFLNGHSFEDTIVKAQQAILPKVYYQRSVEKTFFKQPFLEYLREHHLKLFPYDVPFKDHNHFHRLVHLQQKLAHGFATRDNYIELMDFFVVTRNKSMAERIKTSIEQHTCKKSIVMVGAGHMNKESITGRLESYFPNEQIKTLGEHMNELQLPFQYYILSTGSKQD